MSAPDEARPDLRRDLLQIAVFSLCVLTLVLSGAVFFLFHEWQEAGKRADAAEQRLRGVEAQLADAQAQIATLTAQRAAPAPGLGPLGLSPDLLSGMQQLLGNQELMRAAAEIAAQNPDLGNLLQGQDTEQTLKLGLQLLEALNRPPASPPQSPPSPSRP